MRTTRTKIQFGAFFENQKMMTESGVLLALMQLVVGLCMAFLFAPLLYHDTHTFFLDEFVYLTVLSTGFIISLTGTLLLLAIAVANIAIRRMRKQTPRGNR